MKVAIHHKDDYGWVEYDSVSKEVMVTHSNEAVKNTVSHYLGEERDITVPIGDEKSLGDRSIVSIKPLENQSNLEIALTEMYHATGVHVDWGKNDDIEEDGDKVIVKSLFSNDQYDIIN